MLARAILHGSVTLALISPLVAAWILSLTFFLGAPSSRYEKITYRLVRFFYAFIFSSSLLALCAFFFVKSSSESIIYGQFRIAKDFSFALRLDFDLNSLIFLATCSFITAIITFFSHRYLHRDPGYRRFFITISLFAFGINLIVLSGTLDLIFAGWEIVGLSSFLLIGYFWHRPKAAAAACRAYYIYRLTDLGLLISLLMAHFFWHDVNLFKDFQNTDMSSVLAHISTPWRWLLSISILLPVLGKSAQFPFSFWLPKAMEGPTHSSAIFYGSISIHVGVFLLIKTMPIWYFTFGFHYLLAAIGFITAVSCTLFALVQSNIKGQIGYASVAQVGIMLIELAFGFDELAFIHMIGNAFLRCFQLLVSSSILTTHLHMQNVVRTFGEFGALSLPNLFPAKLRPSLYIFAINDGYFELILQKLFVQPVMFIANACNVVLSGRLPGVIKKSIKDSQKLAGKDLTMRSFSPMLAVLSVGVLLDFTFRVHEFVKVFSLIVALILALAALAERKRCYRALLFAIFGNLFAFLSVTSSKPGLIYLIGLISSSIIALEALIFIISRRNVHDLENYHGLFQQFPLAGTVLLVGILGIVSFPISSTFIGEDILLNISVTSGFHYLLILQLIFIISGIAVIRFYSLLMFGVRDNYVKDVNLDFSPLASLMRFFVFILGNMAAFFLALS